MNQYEPDIYENETTGNRSTKGNWLLPISILIAGVLIAGAVVYSTGKNAL